MAVRPAGWLAVPVADAGEATRTVDGIANRLPWSSRCLERSLAARWMLVRRGRPVTIVIGARRHGFEAHAWLEVDGVVPGAAPAPGFVPIWRHPA